LCSIDLLLGKNREQNNSLTAVASQLPER
jgi:hypothetical protein